MFGEVGLAGEVRGIAQAALRVREAAQMGFRRCIMPEANIDPSDRAGWPATASWSASGPSAKRSTPLIDVSCMPVPNR